MRALLLGLTLCVGCLCVGCLGPRAVEPLASARVVSDFGTYRLERVGLLPPVGVPLTEQQAGDVQAACHAEFGSAKRGGVWLKESGSQQLHDVSTIVDTVCLWAP